MRRLLGEKDRQKESHNPDHGEKRIYAQLLTLSERTHVSGLPLFPLLWSWSFS